MSCTSGSESVVRRSVYQNANTMVEVLVHSKQAGSDGSGSSSSTLTGGRPASGSGSGVNSWPMARPVRKDGRPLVGGPGGGPGAVSIGVQRPRAGPSPVAAGESSLSGGGSASRSSSHGRRASQSAQRAKYDELEQQMKNWVAKINKLVQEISKRPAVSHIRPVLTKLELAMCSMPDLLCLNREQERFRQREHALQQELLSVRRDNDQLQRELRQMSGALQEMRNQATVAADSVSSGESNQLLQQHDATVEALRADLEATKHQLAKHRKYAKEVKKTKQSLVETIQNMDQSHRSELKNVRDQHETQMANILSQVGGETDVLDTYRESMESVQRELVRRVEEIAELKRTLTDRDAEVERLNRINLNLQDRMTSHVRQQLETANAPLGTEALERLLASPPPSCGKQLDAAGSESGPWGALVGESGPWGAPGGESGHWGAAGDSSMILDVSVPVRPAPLPDLSLGSLDVTLAPPIHAVTMLAPPFPAAASEFARGAEGVLTRLEGMRQEIDSMARKVVLSPVVSIGDGSAVPLSV